MKFTGERFLPEVRGTIELEHLHRYLLACEIAAGKTVLDIASGEGYGSAMLARTAGKVFGVDISAEAVAHARKRYQQENLQYLVGGCADIPLADASVDLIVSFETIEHHDQHPQMMREVGRVLRPAGVLLISSPDRQNYSIEPGYSNPFHGKELDRDEFRQLLGTYFKNVAYFGQRILYGSGIFAESLSTPAVSYRRENGSAIRTPGIIKPIYWIALASDGRLPELSSGVLEQPVDDSGVAQLWRGIAAERDGRIAALNEAEAACDNRIAALDQNVAERDGQLAALNRTLAERDDRIAALNQNVAERDSQLAALNRTLAERGARIAALNQNVAERDSQLAALSRTVDHYRRSMSWRVTAPLRFVHSLLRRRSP